MNSWRNATTFDYVASLLKFDSPLLVSPFFDIHHNVKCIVDHLYVGLANNIYLVRSYKLSSWIHNDLHMVHHDKNVGYHAPHILLCISLKYGLGKVWTNNLQLKCRMNFSKQSLFSPCRRNVEGNFLLLDNFLYQQTKGFVLIWKIGAHLEIDHLSCLLHYG